MASSSSSTRSWQDKYLQLLKDHELQEKRFAHQREMLSDGLQQTAFAAQGIDGSLDAALKQVRSRLKTGSLDFSTALRQITDLHAQLVPLRSKQQSLAIENFDALLKNLSQVELPSEISSTAKKLRKGLEGNLAAYSSQGEILNQCLALQNNVFEVLQESHPKRSMWDKVFGHDDKSEPEDETSRPEDSPEARQDEEPEQDQEETSVLDMELESHDIQMVPDTAADKTVAKIAPVLLNLLQSLVVPDRLEQSTDDLREQIRQGIRPYQCVGVLQQVSDLVLAVANPKEFMQYLADLNNELQEIRQFLSGSLEQQTEDDAAAAKLDASLISHMDVMQGSVKDATDLETLKLTVSDQIGDIHSALSDYKNSRENSRNKHSNGDYKDVSESTTSKNDSAAKQKIQAMLTRIKELEEQLVVIQKDLEVQREKALNDALTSLPNREAYSERSEMEFQRWQRYKHDLTISVCDIDLFKKVNDTYGHQAGDKVLQIIAKTMAKLLRKTDFIARYGGEEFVILLPETDQDAAKITLDKIREVISKCPFRFQGKPVQITISFGVSQFVEGDDVTKAFSRADTALYQAKDSGRNCVCIAE